MQKRIDNRPIKDIFPEAKDIIEYAFTLEDKDYFQFSDLNSIPCARGFSAIEYYNELSMRCNRDFLLSHNKAVEDVINNNKDGIRLTDIIELQKIMTERLEFLHEPQIAAKILSVVFFTIEENPYRHDYTMAAKKAEIFMRVQMDEKEFDFFLSIPIVKCLPYISSWSQDLTQYCQTINQITRKHIETISTMLLEESKKIEYFKSLVLQIIKDSD